MLPRRTVVRSLIGVAAVLVAAGCSSGKPVGTARTWHPPVAGQPGTAGAASGAASGDQPVAGAPGAADAEGVATSTRPAAPGVRTSTGSAGVALTFDDGPSPAHTPQILALLREYHVTATFCLIGVNVQAHPELVQAIARDGHPLCNHTWSHDLHLGDRSADAIRADLQRTSDEIHRAAPGVPIRYFRHPGGHFTPAAVAVARDMGMTSIGWDVDPRDWDVHGPETTDHIVSVVKRYTHPGSIVLSHDGGGDRSATVAAYRILLPYLLSRFTLTGAPG